MGNRLNRLIYIQTAPEELFHSPILPREARDAVRVLRLLLLLLLLYLAWWASRPYALGELHAPK